MVDLTASDLHVFRGERHVLRGVSFSAHSGSCLQVKGANGSGKTTLLRTLCGLVHMESGAVNWRGLPVSRDWRAFLRGLTYLGHDAPLKADLTGSENLAFWVGLRRAVLPAELREGLARTGASRFSDRPVSTLSAGQRRRIALAGLWLMGTPLWVLDEPTTNLDADGRSLVDELVSESIARGGIVIAAVHQPLALAGGGTTDLVLEGRP